jgi:glycosyltransferase involved in cell wall biosynthesis
MTLVVGAGESVERLTFRFPISLTPLRHEPLVSVLVANYNYGRYLPVAANSLFAQTYRNWELIICDDGSTDDSRVVIAQLEQRDSRISGICKENGGQASAWNVAYARSTGDIICLLDADDWFEPRKLAVVVDTFRAKPSAGVAYHRYLAASHNSEPMGLPPRPHELPSGRLIERAVRQGGHVFVSKTSDLALRREIAHHIFPLPESLKGYGDAYIGRVAPFITEIAAIPEALSYYRVHQESHSGWSTGVNTSATQVIVESEFIVFDHLQRFLAEQFGPEVAEQVRLSDVRMLWEQMGALYILSGKPANGVAQYSPRQIFEQLSRTRRKYIWTVLFTLPSVISRRLLSLWWSRAGWKQYTRRITRPLGIGDWAS